MKSGCSLLQAQLHPQTSRWLDLQFLTESEPSGTPACRETDQFYAEMVHVCFYRKQNRLLWRNCQPITRLHISVSARRDAARLPHVWLWRIFSWNSHSNPDGVEKRSRASMLQTAVCKVCTRSSTKPTLRLLLLQLRLGWAAPWAAAWPLQRFPPFFQISELCNNKGYQISKYYISFLTTCFCCFTLNSWREGDRWSINNEPSLHAFPFS